MESRPILHSIIGIEEESHTPFSDDLPYGDKSMAGAYRSIGINRKSLFHIERYQEHVLAKIKEQLSIAVL